VSDPPRRTTYFLRSERLGFRSWSDADLELALDLWGDPEVTELIGGPFSNEQVRERLSREIETLRSHGVQYWPVFLLATGDHIGCSGLRPYRPDETIFEIGFHVKKAHWGQGYAPEAARAVMGYAFTTLGASALFAGHHPGNDASRRLLGKLGFRFTHEEHYAPTGLNHPSYQLTAELTAEELARKSKEG
jgi:RimJ/RimL family protein N-acetyltransferase